MTAHLNAVLLMAKAKLAKFFRDERGDVNIVSIVVLIGIAVVLAVIFKDAIADLLNTLLDAIRGKALGAVEATEG